MRRYTYDNEMFYTGFVDSEDIVPSSTNIAPDGDSFILWDGNVWVEHPAQTLTFEENRQNKIIEARMYFDEIVQNSASNSAKFEKDSWETQRQEWMMYISDTEANTPYCNMLASSRGITRDILMEKIGYKVVSFANLQGQMHGLEDIINACSTQAELNQVVW